jgi:hypothetical protein
MSNDMSGPLSDKPDGTTQHAQVANTCLPAGQRPNKAPIFITGVSEARTFQAWLRAACSTPREQPQCCGFEGNHTANYQGCIQWKEARATPAK